MEYIEVSARTVDDAITEALVKLGATSDQIEYEVVDKGSAGFLGIARRDAVIKVRKKYTVEGSIREFLEKIFAAMELKVEILITQNEDDNTYNVELKGDDMGILIGKRGQTLDSLQYLTNLAVNKHSDGYIKVKLDTEDYRQRRKDTLTSLSCCIYTSKCLLQLCKPGSICLWSRDRNFCLYIPGICRLSCSIRDRISVHSQINLNIRNALYCCPELAFDLFRIHFKMHWKFQIIQCKVQIRL